MLKYLFLVLLGVYATHGQTFHVDVQFVNSRLSLHLDETSSNITSVIFHYGGRGQSLTGRGTRSATGFEYHETFHASAGEIIYAYAEIYYNSGLLVTTPRTTHTVGSTALTNQLPGGRQIRAVTFRDDFDSYNHGNWNPEISMFGGMNWEFQVYTPEAKNIYAQGGSLYLRPTLTIDDPRFNEDFLHHGTMDVAQIWGKCTNDGNYGCVRNGNNGLLPPVMSGKVSSVPTVRFGQVEVRAKVPKGDWLWPAIWMMPQSSHYGGWPRSGEIDIMESRGNAGDLGICTVSSTLHWGPSWDQNRYSLTHGERQHCDYHSDWHTWRLEWTQDHIRIFVDNNLIMSVDAGAGFWAKGGFSGSNIWAGGSNMAPFDQDFYLILNVAVGGTNGFFPDNVNWGVRKPWPNNSPHAADDFWNARGDWLPTWNGDQTALIVDYVEFRN